MYLLIQPVYNVIQIQSCTFHHCVVMNIQNFVDPTNWKIHTQLVESRKKRICLSLNFSNYMV